MSAPARLLVVAAAALFAVASCGDQAEGERCDPKNGNADCESGLSCVPASTLADSKVSTITGAALCCPPDNTPGMKDVCLRSGSVSPDGGSTGGSPGTGGSASTGGSPGTGGSTSDASTNG